MLAERKHKGLGGIDLKDYKTKIKFDSYQFWLMAKKKIFQVLKQLSFGRLSKLQILQITLQFWLQIILTNDEKN